jgi:hypothetical protein
VQVQLLQKLTIEVKRCKLKRVEASLVVESRQKKRKKRMKMMKER